MRWIDVDGDGVGADWVGVDGLTGEVVLVSVSSVVGDPEPDEHATTVNAAADRATAMSGRRNSRGRFEVITDPWSHPWAVPPGSLRP